MLYHGRALQPGTEGAEAEGASYGAWWLRSSLALVAMGAGGSLLIAVLTWIALLAGGTAVLPALTGAPASVGSAPLTEVAAGWTLSFFSSQLVPVQLWSASPPGLAFGLGSPLLLVLLVAVSFRAGLRLEGVSSGEFTSFEAAARAAALALPQAILALALLALARVGSGPLAGGPVPALAIALPVLIVGGSAAAGAAWRRERRLGRGAAAGVRGAGLAAIGLGLGCALAGLFATVALLVALAIGQARAGGGLGTVMVGLIYLPNASVLAAAAGLGGGPSLGWAVEATLCALLVGGCLGGAIHLQRRADHLEQIFFALGLPILLLIATIDSRPLVSDHTLGLTPGVAFWVAAVVSAMAAAGGPYLAESKLGRQLLEGWPVADFGDLVPPVARPRPAAGPAPATRSGTTHVIGRLVLGVTAVVMASLITLLIILPPPNAAASPVETISSYLGLEASGDAASLWSRTRVDRSALPASADAELLSQAALAAALRLPANRIGIPTAISVGPSRRTLAGSEYQITFQQDGVRRHRTVILQSDRVLLRPAILAIAQSPGLGTVSLDGAPIADLKRPLAVLPWSHQVASSGSGLWQPVTVMVPPGELAPKMIPVSLAPALAPAALTSAAAAVRDAFAGCQASSSATPAGCPQSLAAPTSGPVTWQLIGDPGSGAAFAGTDDVSVSATGQFQMIGSYAVHVPEGVRHQASGGGYRLSLIWNGTGFNRGTLSAAEIPARARPAVADGVVLDAVRSGFQACLASNLLRPPDCPQTLPSSLFISKVSWTADGDPLAGATVTYDPGHSMLVVSGTYSMSVSYEAGAKPTSGKSSGGYRAELFWDGSRAILVDIVQI